MTTKTIFANKKEQASLAFLASTMVLYLSPSVLFCFVLYCHIISVNQQSTLKEAATVNQDLEAAANQKTKQR